MIPHTLFECFCCTCVFIVRAFHYMGFFTARAFSLHELFHCTSFFIARAFSLRELFHCTCVFIARLFSLHGRFHSTCVFIAQCFYQSFTEAIRMLSTYLKSVYYFTNNLVVSLVDLSTLVAPVFLELSRLGRDLSIYMYLSYHGNWLSGLLFVCLYRRLLELEIYLLFSI